MCSKPGQTCVVLPSSPACRMSSSPALLIVGLGGPRADSQKQSPWIPARMCLTHCWKKTEKFFNSIIFQNKMEGKIICIRLLSLWTYFFQITVVKSAFEPTPRRGSLETQTLFPDWCSFQGTRRRAHSSLFLLCCVSGFFLVGTDFFPAVQT